MKVVTEIKIFGFTICSTYQETLFKTWEKVLRGFEQVLCSWESRQLETLSQRVQVARKFALSKLYYVAQVLPLPEEHRRRVERRFSSFIFRGRETQDWGRTFQNFMTLVLCPRLCQEDTLCTSTCMTPSSRLLVEGRLGGPMTLWQPLSSLMQYYM